MYYLKIFKWQKNTTQQRKRQDTTEDSLFQVGLVLPLTPSIAPYARLDRGKSVSQRQGVY